MQINFIPIQHTLDETAMGHCIWFKRDPVCEAISATANSSGFSPLTAIAREYGWDYKVIASAAEQCNEKNEIAVITQLNPMLFLVPHTHGNENATALMQDLINAVTHTKVASLRFTHYGFVQSKLAVGEISTILKMLANPNLNSTLSTIFWDIDSRKHVELAKLWQSLHA